MKNSTRAKYTIPWLLLSGIAKMKVKESAGSGLDAEPSLDLAKLESELWPLASKQQKISLRPLWSP